MYSLIVKVKYRIVKSGKITETWSADFPTLTVYYFHNQFLKVDQFFSQDRWVGKGIDDFDRCGGPKFRSLEVDPIPNFIWGTDSKSTMVVTYLALLELYLGVGSYRARRLNTGSRSIGESVEREESVGCCDHSTRTRRLMTPISSQARQARLKSSS